MLFSPSANVTETISGALSSWNTRPHTLETGHRIPSLRQRVNQASSNITTVIAEGLMPVGHHGISRARMMYLHLWIDETNCQALGLHCPIQQWDENKGMFNEKPYMISLHTLPTFTEEQR